MNGLYTHGRLAVGTLAALTLMLSGAACGTGRGEESREVRGGHPAGKHVIARADSIVYQSLPAPAVFRSQVPQAMRARLPPDPTPFGNRVQMTEGSIVIEAWDRTGESRPRPPYTDDRAKVEATFTTADGARWKVVQSAVAGRKADGSAFLFGGVGTDVVVHGNTGRENPLMPKMRAALSMWGPAQVYKDDKLIESEALLHIMITSRARTDPHFYYTDYDMTRGPVDEIHLFLNPRNRLPAPGGFLHITWERARVTATAMGPGEENTEPEERARSSWHFDDVILGKLPEGWKAEESDQRGPVAAWAVEADPSAPSQPNVLALVDTKQSRGESFNLLWTDRVEFKDGAIEVKVKAGSGREDQGGGPIWRVRDRNNYYVTRWNPLEDNFRIHYVKNGRRVQLGSAKVKANPARWHTIRIEQMGSEIECWLDGVLLLKVEDKTFPGSGGVGLWTRADAASLFDDVSVSARF